MQYVYNNVVNNNNNNNVVNYHYTHITFYLYIILNYYFILSI